MMMTEAKACTARPAAFTVLSCSRVGRIQSLPALLLLLGLCVSCLLSFRALAYCCCGHSRLTVDDGNDDDGMRTRFLLLADRVHIISFPFSRIG